MTKTTTKIEGKGNISATIIADSISPDGVRITTFELEYPRFIHAEFMTHRLFSRNAASSRAIPVERQIENIKDKTAMPIHWGKNQPGMSAKEECGEMVNLGQLYFSKDKPFFHGRHQAWIAAMQSSARFAAAFHAAGYHKQIVNRLLEPFVMMKTVCTATEYANFFYLRCHPDAQPEIHELADCMKKAYDEHKPVKLEPGEWHVPYYKNGKWTTGEAVVNRGDGYYDVGVILEDAIAISASCCAQVSYRRNDDSLEKARDIYKRLVESKPMHSSPFEHQSTPMGCDIDQAGITHAGFGHSSSERVWWSGNFRGWIQHRQLIGGHTEW